MCLYVCACNTQYVLCKLYLQPLFFLKGLPEIKEESEISGLEREISLHIPHSFKTLLLKRSLRLVLKGV